MSTNGAYGKQRREALIAAGDCGYCGNPREPKTRGGATATRCAVCAGKHRAQNARRRATRAASGECRECGAPCARVSRGAAVPWCAACRARRSARDQARYAAAVTGWRCVRCRMPMKLSVKEPGATATQCAGCARRAVLLCRERAHRKRLAEWDGEGWAPEVLSAAVRIKPKPLGRVRAVGFGLNRDTLDAIQALKARYRESNPDRRFRRPVADMLRAAVASVLKAGGPRCVERERLCQRGWHCTLRMSDAMYQQITKVAKDEFDGSRARAVRVALRQAVNPPAKVTFGKRRVLGAGVRGEWGD